MKMITIYAAFASIMPACYNSVALAWIIYRRDIADANALAVVAKWREEKEAQNPPREVCLRNERDTRYIKVRVTGETTSFQ